MSARSLVAIAAVLGLGLVGCAAPVRPGEREPSFALPGAEELWVFVRSDGVQRAFPDPFFPGDPGARGVLAGPGGETLEPDETELVVYWRSHLADVELRQEFTNTTEAVLQATYGLVLPRHTTLTGFTLELGERRIRAVVQERELAQETFDAAVGQGRLAALVEEPAPNFFAQRLGAVPPGESLGLTLTYFHPVPTHEGRLRLELPALAREGARARVYLCGDLDSRGLTSPWPAQGRTIAHDGSRYLELTGVPVEDAAIELEAARERAAYDLAWEQDGERRTCLLSVRAGRDGRLEIESIDWGENAPLSLHESGSRTLLPGDSLHVLASFEPTSRSPDVRVFRRREAGNSWGPGEWIRPEGQDRTRPCGRDGVLLAFWARLEVTRLTRAILASAGGAEARALADRARRLALRHGLASPWTAFLVVDAGG